MVFCPNGKLLASGGFDKTIRIWDVATGKNIATLYGHSGDVLAVAFSPDGKTLASASFDKSIKLWDVSTGNNIATLTGHFDPVVSVVFSPDGKVLASGALGNVIKLWDVATYKNISNFNRYTDPDISEVDFKGKFPSPVKIPSKNFIINGHAYISFDIAFSPDGKILASGTWENAIKLWDVTTSKTISILKGIMHPLPQWHLARTAKF